MEAERSIFKFLSPWDRTIQVRCQKRRENSRKRSPRESREAKHPSETAPRTGRSCDRFGNRSRGKSSASRRPREIPTAAGTSHSTSLAGREPPLTAPRWQTEPRSCPRAFRGERTRAPRIAHRGGSTPARSIEPEAPRKRGRARRHPRSTAARRRPSGSRRRPDAGSRNGRGADPRDSRTGRRSKAPVAPPSRRRAKPGTAARRAGPSDRCRERGFLRAQADCFTSAEFSSNSGRSFGNTRFLEATSLRKSFGDFAQPYCCTTDQGRRGRPSGSSAPRAPLGRRLRFELPDQEKMSRREATPPPAVMTPPRHESRRERESARGFSPCGRKGDAGPRAPGSARHAIETQSSKASRGTGKRSRGRPTPAAGPSNPRRLLERAPTA